MLNAQTTPPAQIPVNLIVGTWSHLFKDGERLTRIVLDAGTYKLIHLDVQVNRAINNHYRAATANELADVEDSLVNANGDLFDNPAGFGLEAAYELPAWALRRFEPGQVVFYHPDPSAHGPITVRFVATKVDGYSTTKGMFLDYDPVDLCTAAAIARELVELIFSKNDVLFRSGKITARIAVLQRAAEQASF